MLAHLKRSTQLFMDETHAPVLDPGAGKTKTRYLWPLTRGDRGWGGEDPPAVVFTYVPGRSGTYAMNILQGFEGILRVDGYAGYDAFAEPRRVVGHLRRWLTARHIHGANCMASTKRMALRLLPKACAPSPIFNRPSLQDGGQHSRSYAQRASCHAPSAICPGDPTSALG